MDDYDDCVYYEAEEEEDEESTSEEDEDSSDESVPDDDDEDAVDPQATYIGHPYLTKYEKARVLGVRTEQIIAGAKVFVEPESSDPFLIALQELREKRMPLIIRRQVAGVSHDISVNSLDLVEG